jgi:hypothetical protein
MLRSVKIKDNKVFVNSQLLYELESSALNIFLQELYKKSEMSYPKFHKMDNLCKLGILASELLIQKSSIVEKYNLENIGIVLSNSASSIDTDRQHQSTISDKNNYYPSPAIFVYTLPNIVIGEIAIKYKFTGENAFFVTDKFDTDLILNYAEILLNEGMEALIAGWINVDGDDYECFFFIIEQKNPCRLENIIKQYNIE